MTAESSRGPRLRGFSGKGRQRGGREREVGKRGRDGRVRPGTSGGRCWNSGLPFVGTGGAVGRGRGHDGGKRRVGGSAPGGRGPGEEAGALPSQPVLQPRFRSGEGGNLRPQRRGRGPCLGPRCRKGLGTSLTGSWLLDVGFGGVPARLVGEARAGPFSPQLLSPLCHGCGSPTSLTHDPRTSLPPRGLSVPRKLVPPLYLLGGLPDPFVPGAPGGLGSHSLTQG